MKKLLEAISFRNTWFPHPHLTLILFVSPAFAQYFTTDRYHSDITINRDSSFVVRETIEVTFDRPRHGIYREIPFKYREELDKR